MKCIGMSEKDIDANDGVVALMDKKAKMKTRLRKFLEDAEKMEKKISELETYIHQAKDVCKREASSICTIKASEDLIQEKQDELIKISQTRSHIKNMSNSLSDTSDMSSSYSSYSGPASLESYDTIDSTTSEASDSSVITNNLDSLVAPIISSPGIHSHGLSQAHLLPLSYNLSPASIDTSGVSPSSSSSSSPMVTPSLAQYGQVYR
jgi:hypothetical protein